MGFFADLFSSDNSKNKIEVNNTVDELILIKKILSVSLSTKYVLERLAGYNFDLMTETDTDHCLKGKFGTVAITSNEDREINQCVYLNIDSKKISLVISDNNDYGKIVFERIIEEESF